MGRTFDEDLRQQLKDPEFAKEFGVAQAKSSLALTLAEARKKAGFTQEQLAKRVGVSQAYIAKLEGGEANPTFSRIGSLLATVGMSLTTGTTSLSIYPAGTVFTMDEAYETLDERIYGERAVMIGQTAEVSPLGQPLELK